MSTETADPKADHLRSVTITTITALAGIGAGLASGYLTADLIQAGELTAAANDDLAQLALLAAVIVQIPLYQVLGFDEFGGVKDYLFVAFMTFAFWFITWGIIMTTGVVL